MSSQSSFDRLAILNVFNRQKVDSPSGSLLKNIDSTGTAFPSRFADGTTGFRIRFRVEKTQGPTPIPNPVSIFIYNLGATSRALVSKVNNLVVLQAGYGTQTHILFAGNISWTKTRKEGPDYITEIQAADGLFAFQNSLVNQSFGKGVSFETVFKTLTQSLTGAGVGVEQIKGVPTGGYNSGVALSGSAIEQLRQACDKHSLSFSIQDQNVVIVPYGTSRGNPAFYLGTDPNTGLIGIPEIRGIGRAPDGSEKPLISYKCLLNPKMGVLHNVILQSKFVNGLFITTRVTHSGDTFEGGFFTEAEAFQPASVADTVTTTSDIASTFGRIA